MNIEATKSNTIEEGKQQLEGTNIDKNNTKSSIIFERVMFNLVRKLYMTIHAVAGNSELGRRNTDKTGLLRKECRLLN